MVLFPIALLWLVVALIWILRNSKNEPDVPVRWQRFVPRIPRRPWNRGSEGSGGPGGASGSRARARTGEGASTRRD